MSNLADPTGRPYREAFEYQFSPLSPDAAHVDPPAVAVYQTGVICISVARQLCAVMVCMSAMESMVFCRSIVAACMVAV